MKKILLFIIFFSLLISLQTIIEAKSTGKLESISGKIYYKGGPILTNPGKISNILVEIENTGKHAADFAIRVAGDGEYLYFNIKGNDTPTCNPYYGEAKSPKRIPLDPGEIEKVEIRILARKATLRELPITVELYGAKPETNNFFLLDRTSIKAYISESPIQRLNYSFFIFFSALLFVAILIKKRESFDIKDFYFLLFFFSLSILIRAAYIENLPLTHSEEGGYIYRVGMILTNEWEQSKEFIEAIPPVFHYLVAIIIHFFGENIGVLRSISIIFGALDVCLMYILGKSLFDRKVGVLAAFFLCFCNYHILYSRVVMIEALSIFFVFSTMYLFWKGYHEGRGDIYLYFAGFMLGFGTLIKFSSYALIPAFIFFILWTKRSIKALINKKLFILFIVAFLTILPYLFYLYVNDANPFYFNIVNKLSEYTEPGVIKYEHTLFGYVRRSLHSYNILLTNGDYMIPWSSFFKYSSILLFSFTMIYHLYLTLKRRENSSMLVIYLLIVSFLIAFLSSKHRYYLLYLLPAYFILLSSFIVDCVQYIRSSVKPFTVVVIFVLVLSFIFGISYVFIGPLTPIFDKGEYHQIEACVLKIKNHLPPNHSKMLIGTILYHAAGREGTGHYLTSNLCDLYKINATLVSFFTSEREISGKRKYGIDIEGIKRLKPEFIIADEFIISYWTSVQDRKELYQDYYILPFSESESFNPNAYNIVVYRRKDFK
ncbi:MAG: ArnT family glycosyltransferase [Candidatus Methanospirareceae archaeon]